MFSVSTIYSAKDFLTLIGIHKIPASQFNDKFGKFKFDLAQNVLKLSTECSWINLLPDGTITLSERGQIITAMGYKDGLMMQLEDMILKYNPPWAALLPKGREETINYLPPNVRQCFKEAGFEGKLSVEMIRTWDKLSLASRNYLQAQLLQIGRSGEELSKKYETKRTNREPIWQAIESNLSGFDLLSVMDVDSTERLLIEVKTSTSKAEYAHFHVSKAEWETCQDSPNYTFHLWLLDSNPKLFIIAPRIISQHIAINQGQGEWESIRIPFKAVAHNTIPISLTE